MPLTEFQAALVKILSINRSEDSHLAGGAALHFEPQSERYSDDLDYFHDSEARVGQAYAQDKELLLSKGYSCDIEMNQPGYIRCIVKKGKQSTKVEWAHDSAWRFMPVQKDERVGYILHPIDLAINKILALAGRDEARDFLDVLYTHDSVLPLGAQIWAACGKDPGLNPSSLLELLKRRGKYRPEDFTRLHLKAKVDLQELKQKWLKAMTEAETFIKEAVGIDLGTLFYSIQKKQFVQPTLPLNGKIVAPHYGRPGGVIPVMTAH